MSDAGWVALETLLSAIIVAIIAPLLIRWSNNKHYERVKEISRGVADEMAAKLDTGNGHTAGEGIAKIERNQDVMLMAIAGSDIKIDQLEESAQRTRMEVQVVGDNLQKHVEANIELAARMEKHMEGS